MANPAVKLVMFISQEYHQDRPHGLKRKKNIQEFRPGRSAIQWRCGLRLFFKKYLQYGPYVIVLYMVGCIKTSFYLSFGQTDPK